jgi:hypothetical protein
VSAEGHQREFSRRELVTFVFIARGVCMLLKMTCRHVRICSVTILSDAMESVVNNRGNLDSDVERHPLRSCGRLFTPGKSQQRGDPFGDDRG